MLQTLCPKNFITVQQHLTELWTTEKHENEIRQLFLLRQNTDTPIGKKKKHFTMKKKVGLLSTRGCGEPSLAISKSTVYAYLLITCAMV